MYAHISFVNESSSMYLLLLSTNREAFYDLKETHTSIVEVSKQQQQQQQQQHVLRCEKLIFMLFVYCS